ncbi:secreted protein [Beggiatoa sp. PS]|nr:secreted protein [Beggiatoa sp. PS]
MKKFLLCWLIAGLPVISFAQPCTDSQNDSAKYLAKEAGNKIVEQFSGGQNIRVEVSQCDYNTYSKTVTLNMKVSWNGKFFSSNHYDISGILEVKSDGASDFSQTNASSGVQKLEFFQNFLDGTLSLGTLFVTNYLEDIVQGDNETSNLTEFSSGKQEGIQQCLDDPQSCGIDIFVEFNKGKQEGIKLGIQQCLDDPNSCGINMPDAIVSENTLKNDCIASYSLNGQLHIPCVSVPDVFGGITIYDIKMNQQTGAFIFDLDMDSVKPR